MAHGSEDWDVKSEVISEEDEARMLSYLQKTGKYNIQPSYTSAPHFYPKPSSSFTPRTPSCPSYVHTPGTFPIPTQLYPPSLWPVYQQPPRISLFSGEDPVPKGETTFENWKFEIRCLMKDETLPTTALTQAVRKSLRGDAARLLVSLGEYATITDILQRLEGPYGTIVTAESLLQEFHQSSQQERESVASWAIRLEDLLLRALDRGAYMDTQGRNAMLRNRFWTGLRNPHLKDATRHAFYSSMDFNTLLQTVRLIEQELTSSQPPRSRPPRSTHQPQTLGFPQPPEGPTTSSHTDISEQLTSITRRLEKLETAQKKPSADNKILQQILDRLSALESQKENPPTQVPLQQSRSRGRGRRGSGRGTCRGI